MSLDKKIANKKKKVTEKYESKLNKDAFSFVFPSIMIGVVLITIITGIVLVKRQIEPYEYKSNNYHTLIQLDDVIETTLTDAELTDSQVIFRYKTKNLSEQSDMGQKKIYLYITDMDNNELYGDELKGGESEVEIKLNDLIGLTKENFKDFVFNIDYYVISDEIELNYTKPIDSSKIAYTDLYLNEDITDYFEKEKSKDEKEAELNYIQRKYLTPPQLQEATLDEDTSTLIDQALKEDIEEQHKQLGDLYKYNVQKIKSIEELLIEKGTTEEEINEAMSSKYTFNEKVENMQLLVEESDEKLQKINSGYMKELNQLYGYSPEQIKKIVDGKTAIEQKKALEKEVTKQKNDTSSELKEVKEKAKKLKVDNKKLDKILNDKTKADKIKIKEIKELIKDKEEQNSKAKATKKVNKKK